MPKFLFLYDEAEDDAVRIKTGVQTAVTNYFNGAAAFFTPGGDLSAADYLVIIAVYDEDFYIPKIESAYKFFTDELAWKRKEYGKIILILDENVSQTKIPFSLKKYPQVDAAKYGKIMPLIVDFEKARNEQASQKTRAEDRRQPGIVYSPAKINVSARVEYNPVLPTVNQFDFNAPVPQAAAKQSAVKQSALKQVPAAPAASSTLNHNNSAYNKNPHSHKYNTSTKNNNGIDRNGRRKNAKKGGSSKGCAFAVFLFFIALFIAIFFGAKAILDSRKNTEFSAVDYDLTKQISALEIPSAITVQPAAIK